MAIVTLNELALLDKQNSFSLGNSSFSGLSQQQHFQKLVEQKRIGLNIEPLLDDRLSVWLEQLESFIPGIFNPHKKVYLNAKWQAQLMLKEADIWLEVPINAGVVKNKVRLYEWRIGSTELNWHDRVKLWVACRYLQYCPEDLVMVICAFSPKHNGHIQKTSWDTEDFRAVEEELYSLLTKDSPAPHQNPVDKISELLANIDEIEEVKL